MDFQTYFNCLAEAMAQKLCGKSYGRLTWEQAEYVNDYIGSQYIELFQNGLI